MENGPSRLAANAYFLGETQCLILEGLLLDKQPSSKTISIRLPESLLEAIKVLANKRDVPYQSMMKVLLAEKVREELNLQDQSEKAF